SDMVETFLKGINSRLARALEKYLAETMGRIPVDVMAKQLGLSTDQHEQLKVMVAALGEITCDVFSKESAALQQREHVSPVRAALGYAPKEELAELAESLVHLTSLKRRVALETETVGGPIDVAIISKGDGFIWIKRKHYFRPELNPYFLATY